jgi:transposase
VAVAAQVRAARLALAAAQELVRNPIDRITLLFPSRKKKKIGSMKDRKIMSAIFYVLRTGDMFSSLTNLGFLLPFDLYMTWSGTQSKSK